MERLNNKQIKTVVNNKNIYFNHTFIKLLLPTKISKSFIFINRLKNISITIRDSYLILPSSLKNLSVQFKVDQPKLIEPVFIGVGHSECAFILYAPFFIILYQKRPIKGQNKGR